MLVASACLGDTLVTATVSPPIGEGRERCQLRFVDLPTGAIGLVDAEGEDDLIKLFAVRTGRARARPLSVS